MFFAGLTSLINLYEAPIATVQEKFHLGRVAACGVIGVIGVVVSLLIQGIVSQWMDVLSIYICPLGAGLAGVMFFWICGKKYVQSQVDKGRSSKFTDLYYPICKYIYVPICVLVLILGIVRGRNRLETMLIENAPVVTEKIRRQASFFDKIFQIYKSD